MPVMKVESTVARFASAGADCLPSPRTRLATEQSAERTLWIPPTVYVTGGVPADRDAGYAPAATCSVVLLTRCKALPKLVHAGLAPVPLT